MDRLYTDIYVVHAIRRQAMFLTEVFECCRDSIDLPVVGTHETCVDIPGACNLFFRSFLEWETSPSFVLVLLPAGNKTKRSQCNILISRKLAEICYVFIDGIIRSYETRVGFCCTRISLSSKMVSHSFTDTRIFHTSHSFCPNIFILPLLSYPLALRFLQFRVRPCSSYTFIASLYLFSGEYLVSSCFLKPCVPIRMQLHFTADNFLPHLSLFFSPSIPADTFASIGVVTERPSIDHSQGHIELLKSKSRCFSNPFSYLLSNDSMSFPPQLSNGVANSMVAIFFVVPSIHFMRFNPSFNSLSHIKGNIQVITDEPIAIKIATNLFFLGCLLGVLRDNRSNIENDVFNWLFVEGIEIEGMLHSRLCYTLFHGETNPFIVAPGMTTRSMFAASIRHCQAKPYFLQLYHKPATKARLSSILLCISLFFTTNILHSMNARRKIEA